MLILVLLGSQQIAPNARADGEGLDVMGGIPIWPSPDVIGVKPLAMGNSGLALAGGMEAMYLNPAGLALMPPASVAEGSFYLNLGASSRIFNVSVADSKTNPQLAAGASYSNIVFPRESDGKISNISGHVARLSLAGRWKSQVFFGASFKYLFLTQPFHTPINSINIDAGVTWQIIKNVSLSAVGYNLIYNKSKETPISAGLGVALGGSLPFKISVDWILDFQSKGEWGNELRMGAQYTFLKYFALRAGYQLDQVRDRQPIDPRTKAGEPSPSHFISGGIGLKYARFGLDIAFRQQLSSGITASNRMLALAIQILF